MREIKISPDEIWGTNSLMQFVIQIEVKFKSTKDITKVSAQTGFYKKKKDASAKLSESLRR